MFQSLVPGSLDRRELLRMAVPAMLGLGAARAATPKPADETSVILVYCVGGASHLETYDLKPDGPEMMRSVFKPIATRVPGLNICEHLPRHAQVADRFSVIRSMTHKINIHNDGWMFPSSELASPLPAAADPPSPAPPASSLRTASASRSPRDSWHPPLRP